MENWYKRALVPALLAIFVFAFSLASLWLGDDIVYGYSFKDFSRITSFDQVIPSQVAHYHVQNGRIPAHFLCQLFIPFWGQTVFSICNALVYVLWLFLLARLCNIRYNDWWMMALLSCLLILGLRTKFTPTCQIGFPWMFTLVTAFLLVFKEFGDTRSPGRSLWHLLWAVPLSFLAGWSNEALVIGVGAALGIYVLWHIKALRLSQWMVLAAFVSGAALLCFSPASVGRVGESHANSDLLPPIVLSLAKLAFYLRATYLMFALVLYLLLVKKISARELVDSAGYWWIVWAVMLVFNLLIGVYGNRQLFGAEFAAIIITVKYGQAFLFPESREKGKAGTLVLGALVLYVVVVGIGNTRFLKHHWKIYRTIDAAYKDSPDGRVYYDFSAAEVTADDTYPSDVFSWHALESMSRAYGENPALSVVPTLCRDLDQRATGNAWEKIAKGTMAIVIDKNASPRGIGIQRTLLGKSIPDLVIPASAGAIYEDDNHAVLLVYEKMPLVRNVSVSFLE